MLKYFSFLSFMILCQTLSAQDLDETLEYINENLNFFTFSNLNNTNVREGGALIKGDTKELSESIFLYQHKEKWEISDYGELKITIELHEYEVPAGTPYPKWRDMAPLKTGKIKQTIVEKVYIKALSKEINLEQKYDVFSKEYYSLLKFRCENQLEQCISSTRSDSETDTHYLKIRTAEDANKIANAIIHLIELAKNDSKFRDKDPFKN